MGEEGTEGSVRSIYSNYDYRNEELREIAENIKTVSRHVPVVQAILNNNYQDQGQRNARTLAGFLK